MPQTIGANPFLFKVVHGFRQDVNVTCSALLLGSLITSIPVMNSSLAFVSVSDSPKLVSSRVSSTSTYRARPRKLILTSPVLSLTLWYPRHKLQYRVGLFFGAASISGAFSGILAYGISFMSGTAGKLGWSWIFVRSIWAFATNLF